MWGFGGPNSKDIVFLGLFSLLGSPILGNCHVFWCVGAVPGRYLSNWRQGTCQVEEFGQALCLLQQEPMETTPNIEDQSSLSLHSDP